MKNTRDVIWGTALAMVLAFAVITSVSAANDDTDSSSFGHHGRYMNDSSDEAMMEAMNQDTYEGWKAAVSELPFGDKLLEYVTADNFDKFQEAHQLMLDGKYDEAHAIMEEIGIDGMGPGHGPGMMGDRAFNNENYEAMMTAVENGDYETWKSLVSDSPRGDELLSKITADNFSKFQEAHQLMQDGKYDEAKTIFDELGLDQRMGRDFDHDGRGMGMRGGMMNWSEQ